MGRLGVSLLLSAAAVSMGACQSYQYTHPTKFGQACEDIKPEAVGLANPPVECMSVYFGTNRKLLPLPGETDANWSLISTSENEDAGDLAIGRADVWVPMMVQDGESGEVTGRVAGVTELLTTDKDITEFQERYFFFITRMAVADAGLEEVSREVFKGDLSEALDSYDGKSLLLFVHGFNEVFEHMIIRAAQLSYDLTNMPNVERDEDWEPGSGFQAGVPVLFTWPSQARLLGYGLDQQAAADARPHLKSFLNLLTETEGVERINIIAHSMGNHVLVKTLEEFARDYRKAKPDSKLEFQIIIAAADIEADIFDEAANAIDELEPNVTIYTSSRDLAMWISSIVNGEFTSEFPFWKPLFRLGDSRRGRPYVRPDERYATIDATKLKSFMQFWKIGHGYYNQKSSVLGDMACALQNVPIEARALDSRPRRGDADGLEYYVVDPSIIPDDDRCSVVRPYSPLDGNDFGDILGVGGGVGTGKGGGGYGSGSGIGQVPGLGGGNPRPPPPPPPAPPPTPPITSPPPASTGCIADSPEFELYFDFDESELSADDLELIDAAVDHVQQRDDCKVQFALVVGHTDRAGAADYNLKLAERRANSVRDALIARGIPEDRIEVSFEGEGDPALITEDGEREPLNRRVQVLILLNETAE